jgi:hypothetical protein
MRRLSPRGPTVWRGLHQSPTCPGTARRGDLSGRSFLQRHTYRAHRHGSLEPYVCASSRTPASVTGSLGVCFVPVYGSCRSTTSALRSTAASKAAVVITAVVVAAVLLQLCCSTVITNGELVHASLCQGWRRRLKIRLHLHLHLKRQAVFVMFWGLGSSTCYRCVW